jgi:SpoIID/LytB domain protein
MQIRNKRLLSFFTTLVFLFSIISSLHMNKVQAYSNKRIFEDVRVGLVSMSNTTLTAVLSGSYTLNGTQLPSGTVLSLKVSNGLVNVNGTDYSEVALLPLSASNLVTLTSGTVSYKYQGKFLFRVSSGKILPVNSLDLESYLKGVVGYEMSDYFPLEALKAQAVAARNYALFKLGAEAAKGYDFDDTVMYQVYKGYDDRLKNVIRAVDDTSFVVLLHNDKLIEALYSAWHGGHSEDAVNVWGNSVIYLKAKADSFENDPWPNGNRSFTNAQVDSTLKTRGWLLSTDTFVRLELSSITRFASGRVANIDILYRDSSGTLNTKSVTRDRTRTFLGLPSNMYNVVYDSGTGVYTFSGKGHGHGLGMSQIGAKNRAANGQTYEQILKFYYDGSYLQNLTPKASIASFTVSSKEIYINDSVDIYTMGAGGSGQYLYKYQILRDGTEVFATEFSENSALNYEALLSGSYEIISYIKDKYSPLTFDEKQSKALNVIDKPLALINTVSQSAEKSLIDQPVVFQAVAGAGTLYKFEVLRENVILQSSDFSTSDSFVFVPQQPGTYSLKVYSKHPLSTNEYDDSKSVSLTAYDNPVISSYTSSTTEALLGQQLDFSTAVQGGSGSYLYNFIVMKDLGVVTESGYTSSSSFSYLPSGTGKYQVYAYLKDSLSSKHNDMKMLEVTVRDNTVNMVASIDKKETITGQPVRVSATGSGGSGKGFVYIYEVVTGGKVVSVKDFSTEASFVYTPTVSGSYLVNVYVKDTTSLKEFDTMSTVDFEAFKSPEVTSAKSTGKMFINTPVTISSDIKPGSPAGFTSRYQIQFNGSVIAEREFSSSSEFSFTPDRAGKYTLSLYVKDNLSVKSFDAIKTFDMEIASTPMTVSKLPIKSGMTGPDVVTIQTGLTELGFYTDSINGVFDSKTSSAVSGFQRSVKLSPTGRVDNNTFNAMNNALINIAETKTITY